MSRIDFLRDEIEFQYAAQGGTGCGASFGELLCWELHTNGKTFVQIADKWGVSLHTLGALIADHCQRMEALPVVKRAGETAPG